MGASGGLPAVRSIGPGAPFQWLAGGWSDLWKAPGPLLVYGLAVAILSAVLCYGLYQTNGAYWVLALSLGFVIIAPILAMGPYEAGRRLELGQPVRLGQIVLVRTALRQDSLYLSLALALLYMFWGQTAQIVYGLSTYQSHGSIQALVAFALETPDGHAMLIAGTLVGGAIAFLAFALVVVSAPMLLDPGSNGFIAIITSVRTVVTNPGPMILWALLIVLLLLISAATGFLALTVIFPWLGLASWRACRALVEPEAV
jgi:uncharacterized membrane protein